MTTAERDEALSREVLGDLAALHPRLRKRILTALNTVREDAATSMRSLCAEKVKAMRGKWHDRYVAADSSNREALVAKELLFAKYQAANEVIKELESLSIQEQKP